MEIDLTNLPKIINPVYWPLLKNKDRYLVLMGGGGSGKSVFATQKIIYRMLTEKNHKFLVVRKVGDTLRDSVFAELINTINMMGMTDLFTIPRGRSSDLYIKCNLNGNECLFFGLDNVEKRKSISGITGVWCEEASELDVSDYRQLDIRMRTKTNHYLQMIITFNPISISHWLKGEFFDVKKENTTTLKTTYKDNRFLIQAARDTLESFRLSDSYYYSVYCLGEWGVLGQTVFNAQIITIRLAELRNKPPLKTGYFTYEYENQRIIDETIKWIDTEPQDAMIRIYEEPIKGHPYSAGGDTAGDGSDHFVLNMLENTTGKQVAVLHHQYDEDMYARQCYCMGKYYGRLSGCNGDALLAIETNFSTYPNKELQRLGYMELYTREQQDTYTGKLEKRYGFRTDKLSRPMLIANLVKIVREHIELFNDIPTLEEMLVFVRDPKTLKPMAQEGKHDDLVMGTGISYVCRDQGKFSIVVEHEPPKLKLADKLGLNKKKKKKRRY